MGFFDYFLGKKKESSPASAPQPETKPLELSFSELEEFLDKEKEKSLAEIYPSSSELIQEILGEIHSLAAVLKDFEQKEVRKDMDHYRIAIQMKENFFKRVPALLEIKAPETISFDSLVHFHSRLFHSIASITKITSDNRYLIAFFGSDMDRIGKSMKSLASLNDELKKEIDSKASVVQEFNSVKDHLHEIRNLEYELEVSEKNKFKFEQEAVVLEKEKKELETELIENKQKAEAELAALERDVSSTKDVFISVVSPLERPLRKFERICLEKEQLNAVKKLLDSPVDFLLSENGEKAFKALLEKLKKAVDADFIEKDTRVREKILQHIERAISTELSVEKLRQSLDERRRKHAAVEGVKRQEMQLADLGKRLESALVSSKEVEKKTALLKEEIPTKLKLIEEEAGRLSNRVIHIRS
ncbi:hypothetical protein HY991_04645 [Candidatus Micrarchaeota archaeon]|nr:hypothetical protein [Candidatus Micrarchaeota archaeon]